MTIGSYMNSLVSGKINLFAADVFACLLQCLTSLLIYSFTYQADENGVPQ